MDVQKVTRTANGMTGSKQIVLSFAEPQTLGRMVKGTAAGATQIVDKDGRILPRVGDVLDSSLPGLVAQTVDVTPVDGKTWQITVSYNNTPLRFSANNVDGKAPWEQLPIIRWSSASEQIVAERYYRSGDTRGNPSGLIRLPNGRPYFDPPLANAPMAQANVSWNTKNSILNRLSAIEFTVNSVAIDLAPRTLGAGTGFIQNISENEELTEEGEKYYSHEAAILYRPDGHYWTPVSLDYYAIIDGKLRRVQIKEGKYGYWGNEDPEAMPTSDPVYINSAGGLLTTDPQDTNLTPHVSRFPLLYPADWGLLEFAK